MLAVVPPAVGFWLVAGNLAGVGPNRVHTLLVGSLLTLGAATMLSVVCGFRMTLYEGPAAAYLAAIAVLGSHGHGGPAGISGGLLVAGALVFLLALLRADRLMVRVLTPLVSTLFVLTVTVAVMPATLERAVGATHGLPGNASAWISSLTVVIVTLTLRRVRRLGPYSLLAALLAGTVVYFGLAGLPDTAIGGGLAAPGILPWGAPSVGAGVAIPFALAGALAAFNTVATGGVVAAAERPTLTGRALAPSAARRALLSNAATQAVGALVGNLVGTVSRLDSLGIVRLIGNPRRRPLVLAGAAITALAFVTPVVDLAVAIPLSVSAALLAVILAVIIAGALQTIVRQPKRTIAFVAVPALAPTAAWVVVGSSLSPDWQLVANPLLWGVLLSVSLERIVGRRASPAPVLLASQDGA